VSVATWFPPTAEGGLPFCIALYRALLFCWKGNKLTRKVAVLKIAMRFGTCLFKGELDQTKKYIITIVLTVPLDSITLRNTTICKLTPSRCLFTYRHPVCCIIRRVVFCSKLGEEDTRAEHLKLQL
jgi:hypothetical protein